VVIGPTSRELRELNRVKERLGIELETHGQLTRDCASVDAKQLIESAVERYRGKNVAGVIGSDDLGSLVAAVVAKRLKVAGPSPLAVFRTQQKYLCRVAVARALDRKFGFKMRARTVPDFRLAPFDSKELPLKTPFFLKPAKGHLSMYANRIDSLADFEKAMKVAQAELPKVNTAYEQILSSQFARANAGAASAVNSMIAEGLIEGDQVTVEGFIHNGRARVIGIVDSVMYPGTRSFKQFDYPSHAPKNVQARMAAIARIAATASGLDNTMFNIEMSHDPRTGDVKIIEVNSRMSSQFADLFEKVDGVNTYEITLALAAGERPRFTPGGGEFACASSFVFRAFEDKKVRAVPTVEQIEAVKRDMPDARIEVLAQPGAQLSDSAQDVGSYRYAIISLGGKTESDLEQKREAAERALPFELESVPSSSSD
jgi:hypothetical protein